MQIEEAKKVLGYQLNMKDTDVYTPINYEAIDTVLNELERYKQLINKKNARLNEYAEDIAEKDKVIDEMAKSLYDYANLEVLIRCPAEYEGRYNMDLCKMNIVDRNCLVCIKEYFYKKVMENK